MLIPMRSDAYDRLFEIEATLWWYRGRRAVCKRLLDRALPATRDLRVLDVGCGTGFNMRLFERYGAVEGVDTAAEALAYCRRRGLERVRQADAASLPFADDTFDLVTALDIIEHLDDDVAALREFARVLKPGGTLLVYTPALPALYGDHDRVVGHRRRYMKRLLRDRLEAAGYTVRHLSYVNLVVLPAVLLVRLALRWVTDRPHVEMSLPPSPANALLTLVSWAEVPLVTRLGLPFGLSLVALARRSNRAVPRAALSPGR